MGNLYAPTSRLLWVLALAACGPGDGLASAGLPASSTGSTDDSASTVTVAMPTDVTVTDGPTGPDTTTVDATTLDTTTVDATTLDSETAATSGAPLDCTVVMFADANLEANVRFALAQPEGPILGETLAQLTELFSGGINELGGLECAVGLEVLSIGDGSVVDLSPLAGLPALRGLSLAGTPVTDLGPLAGLSALRHLTIARTQVVDLGPLAGLALEGINARESTLADLGPLASVSTLTRLDITASAVTDLQPLSGLVKLRELYAGQAPLAGLPLSGCVALEYLEVPDTAITSLNGLQGLPALEYLDIARTAVSDLTPLQGLPIKDLFASECHITDVAPLASLPRPRMHDLRDNTIVEVGALLGADWGTDDPANNCGDVLLAGNPLSAVTRDEVIPAVCTATTVGFSADPWVECPGGDTCLGMP